MHSGMTCQVVSLRRFARAPCPVALEAERSGALAADMGRSDVLIKSFGVGEVESAVEPLAALLFGHGGGEERRTACRGFAGTWSRKGEGSGRGLLAAKSKPGW